MVMKRKPTGPKPGPRRVTGPLQPGRREVTGPMQPGRKVTLGKVPGRRLVTDASGNKISYTNESGQTWDYAKQKFVQRTSMPAKSRTQRTSMPKKAPQRKRGY